MAIISRALVVSLILTVIFCFSLVADNVVTSAQVSSQVPIASGASLNSGSTISLNANQTTVVNGTVTVTDDNGCEDIKNVTAVLYRTDIAGGPDAPDNNRNHYTVNCTSNGDCAGAGDLSASYTCSFGMLWYADPTDLGSLYDTTDWTFNATPTDGNGGVSDSDSQEVGTLSALDIVTASVNFGQMSLGENTSDVNQNTSIANTGNEGLDVMISTYGSIPGDGYSMVCTVGNIAAANMEYNQSPFTYGSGTNMSSSDTLVDLDLPYGNDTTVNPTKEIYYGLGFPTAGIAGTCNGTIVITAEPDPMLS